MLFRSDPPAATEWKCYTDGRSMGTPSPGAVAGEFRNSRGIVIGCFNYKITRCYAFEAELLAAILTISFAHNRGCRALWLETDSTYVEGLLMSRSELVPWIYRNRWLSVLQMLESMVFKVSHIFREGNTVADKLASLDIEGCWWHSLADIQDLVDRDRSGRPYFHIKIGRAHV